MHSSVISHQSSSVIINNAANNAIISHHQSSSVIISHHQSSSVINHQSFMHPSTISSNVKSINSSNPYQQPAIIIIIIDSLINII